MKPRNLLALLAPLILAASSLLQPAQATLPMVAGPRIVAQQSGGGSGEFLPAPSWMSGMVRYQWEAVSGSSPDMGLSATNTANDVAGSFSPFANEIDGIWEGWNSFTYTTAAGESGQFRAWGGGHNANEWPGFFVWDVATRVWSRDARGVPATTTVTSGLYSTGSPVPPHTYYAPHVRTSTGEIVEPVSETTPGDPATKFIGFRRYDPVAGTWSGGAINFAGNDAGDGVCGVYDPDLDRSVVLINDGGVDTRGFYYDHSTGGSMTSFDWPVLNSDAPCTLLPAVNGRTQNYMIAGATWSGSGNRFIFINTSSPNSATRVSATLSDTHSDHTSSNINTYLFYSIREDAIYETGADPAGLMELHRYQAPTTIPGTWSGADVPVTADSPIQNFIQSGSQGGDQTRGKAQFMHFAGGEEMVCVSGWHTHPVYCMRIDEDAPTASLLRGPGETRVAANDDLFRRAAGL